VLIKTFIPIKLWDNAEVRHLKHACLKDVIKSIKGHSKSLIRALEHLLVFRCYASWFPAVLKNLLRRRRIKIRKRISMSRQELGGVQPMWGKRCRRRRRKAVGHRARKKEKEKDGRRFAAAMTAAHFPTLLSGRCAVRVPFLSSACARSLPSSCQVFLVSPGIADALRQGTTFVCAPSGHGKCTKPFRRRKSLPQKRKLRSHSRLLAHIHVSPAVHVIERQMHSAL